jgi:MFS family permease
MTRANAAVLLAVFGSGVFLAGLELMITAVALPAIIVDLAPDPILGFRDLRKASWIINGYLLVYIIAMPLSGRLTDLWGARRLFMLALAVFTVGSALAGRAQSVDELIAARLIQAAGGGVLVPVATAAASHLFTGHARPRALGLIGALTFLGMAAGPFVGAAILGAVHAEVALANARIEEGVLFDAFVPAWRWVFYVNVPIGIAALALGWAASYRWDTPRHAGRVDIVGGLLFSLALAAGLIGVTLIGGRQVEGGFDPVSATPILLGVAAVAIVLTIVLGLRRDDPFLDPRLFRRLPFSSATIVSLLTGYTFATAIIGAAVFVDRVVYGGPDDQRLALGALAGATAIGALVSGLALRVVGLRAITIVGLVASTLALVVMSRWTPATPIGEVASTLAVFGAGFGLTVTPRSTAAVESVGRRAFGVASATVTVARMVGMTIGLAALTAYGSTNIDRLYDAVYASETAYQQFIPEELRDRPLRDGLVVEALESWAAGEASQIMVGIFLAAAIVSALAAPAALAMGGRPRMLAQEALASGGPERDVADDRGPSLAL